MLSGQQQPFSYNLLLDRVYIIAQIADFLSHYFETRPTRLLFHLLRFEHLRENIVDFTISTAKIL